MWDCIECGCRAIAGSLTRCPTCWKERKLPTTTTGGSSNQYEQLELPLESPQAEPITQADAEPPAPEPAPAPEPELAASASPDAGEEVPEPPQPGPPQHITASGGITLPSLGAENG